MVREADLVQLDLRGCHPKHAAQEQVPVLLPDLLPDFLPQPTGFEPGAHLVNDLQQADYAGAVGWNAHPGTQREHC